MGLLKFLGNFLGVLSPAHISWVTLSSGGKKIGQDQLGNKYYRSSAKPGYKKERRWVIYKGRPDASKVPPEWHGWLHHQSDKLPPEEKTSFRRVWQKPHRANMTGTDKAYRQPGHVLEGGKRDAVAADYESWTPPK